MLAGHCLRQPLYASFSDYVVIMSTPLVCHHHSTKGWPAKPTRSEKVEVELIFDFRDGKKPQVYPLRYIEDFFPFRKLEERLKIRFRSREGFCRPSIGAVGSETWGTPAELEAPGLA
jgi:hypothetical protein